MNKKTLGQFADAFNRERYLSSSSSEEEEQHQKIKEEEHNRLILRLGHQYSTVPIHREGPTPG